MLHSIRSLQIFVAVAEELHFRKAAERLHMTQPPLSMHIKQLEESMGVHLFSRTTRSVQLTPAGKELQRHATRLLLELDEMAAEVRRVGNQTCGSLSLGFPASTMFDTLPTLLAIQRSRYPEVALNLKESPSTILLESVRARQLDVALVRALPSEIEPDLHCVVAAREAMLLALPLDHPFAKLDAVPIQRLNRIPFIGFSENGSHYFHALTQKIFSTYDVQPMIVHESVVPTILALVEARLGLAIVPASMAMLRTHQLTYRPTTGTHGMDVSTLYCVWRPDAPQTARNFVDIVDQAGIAEFGEERIDGRASASGP